MEILKLKAQNKILLDIVRRLHGKCKKQRTIADDEANDFEKLCDLGNILNLCSFCVWWLFLYIILILYYHIPRQGMMLSKKNGKFSTILPFINFLHVYMWHTKYCFYCFIKNVPIYVFIRNRILIMCFYLGLNVARAKIYMVQTGRRDGEKITFSIV